jgi:hypothetical protein
VKNYDKKPYFIFKALKWNKEFYISLFGVQNEIWIYSVEG